MTWSIAFLQLCHFHPSLSPCSKFTWFPSKPQFLRVIDSSELRHQKTFLAQPRTPKINLILWLPFAGLWTPLDILPVIFQKTWPTDQASFVSPPIIPLTSGQPYYLLGKYQVSYHSNLYFPQKNSEYSHHRMLWEANELTYKMFRTVPSTGTQQVLGARMVSCFPFLSYEQKPSFVRDTNMPS
jgi:hypothetical protein